MQFSGSEPERCRQLLARVTSAARAGVDYIQLREKDLSSRELEALARTLSAAVHEHGEHTRLLINSRCDVALAVQADGVHLRSSDISPSDIRRIWHTAADTKTPIVAASCHSPQEVAAAKDAGADFVVFGPVFGKSENPGSGLTPLQQACAAGIPVLALGAVTTQNAQSCVSSGAAGVAGIRLFQQGDLATTVRALRERTASR